jgi:DNA-binding transcriptional ArsR family regulator
MAGDVDIATVAALLADATRVNILTALCDGRAFPAGELAQRARVAPSTISGHLAKLIESDFIAVTKQGRHRYYRLANPAIAATLEELAVLAPATIVRSLHDDAVGEAVRRARTCYNHLAGMLGVALTQALVEKQILLPLEDGYTLSEDGEQWLQDFGIDSMLKKKDVIFAPHHIDWSERRYHIAGALGGAIMKRLFEMDWIRRIPSSRAVRVTEDGYSALKREFGLQW